MRKFEVIVSEDCEVFLVEVQWLVFVLVVVQKVVEIAVLEVQLVVVGIVVAVGMLKEVVD